MPIITNILRAIIREPYIHFLFVGLLLYLYYQRIHPSSLSKKKESIVIEHSKIENINQTLSKQLGRELHPSELNLMIERLYFEKILLHEALDLKLEQKDREIQRKLITQMRQILTPVAVEPSEEQLYHYYQKHRDDYGITHQISFAHIYFKEKQQRDIKSFVEMLNLKSIEPQNAMQYGDKFAQGNQISSWRQSQVKQLFGKYFAKQIWRLQRQRWYGAIRSRYGYHIVFITQKQSQEFYSFDEVEDRVYSDYMQEQKDEALLSSYKKLSTQYILKKR